jgi:hypothetical protein
LQLPGPMHKKAPPPQEDLVSILERDTDGTKVKLRVKLQGKTWEDLSNFIREHAFLRASDVLSRLFEYGVTQREGIDLEARRSEIMALGSRHAAMRFEASKLCSDNAAMTMALSIGLEENRRIRKLAEARGLIQPCKEPWDDWNKDDVEYFYSRYLFVERG